MSPTPTEDRGRATLDLDAFRARFPGAALGPYLNVADHGLISVEVRSAVDAYLDGCVTGDSKDAPAWAELARRRFAQLVRATEHEIALVKNVSDGINAVATAIDWRPGDNVILCEELEHPSNLYVWRNLRERCGITVHRVEAVDGHIDAERMSRAIDQRTRVVAASMVTFVPGFRTDIAVLGQACRARGALFVVDAAQAVGVLDVDLSRLPVDALVVGTPKALLGLYGMGFLFVREAVAERLRPAYLSGAGLDRAVFDGTGNDRLALRRGAGRFEVGNFNRIGCVAAAVSIEQLQAAGSQRIERHALEMARLLSDGLSEHGLPVFHAGMDSRRSNIVAVGSHLDASIDSTSDTRLKSLQVFLLERRVQLSIRRGMLRFSTHGFTSRQDIQQTLESVSKWQRSAGA